MASHPDAGELIKSITDDVRTIVKGEIELAKAELMPQAKSAGLGAGLLGAAAYLGIVAAGLIFTALSLGVAALLPASLGLLGASALGFAIVAVVLLVLAGLFALIGSKRLKVKGPDATVAEAQASVETVKAAITDGLEDVKNGTTRRLDLSQIES